MEQRSPEWFEARLGLATASRFADILSTIKSGGEAATRRNYRAQLVVERLTGVSPDSYHSKPMEWGEETEELARVAYSLKTGNDVEEVGFIRHSSLKAGASPDGFVGKTGLVEIKCPNTATHIESLKTVKGVQPKYYPQVQGQLWITGRLWCDFVSYDPRLPEKTQMLIRRIARDEDYIQKLEFEVTKFLEEVDQEVNFLESYQEAEGVKIS